MLYGLRREILLFWEQQYLDFKLPAIIEALPTLLENIVYGDKPSEVPITKPIFIVGCHRSGTTILYDTLAQHPDVAYFTNASSYLPKSPICANWIASAMLGETKIERFVKDGIKVSCNSPNEGTRLWEHHTVEGDSYCLDETYHNLEMEYYLKSTIQKHLRYFKVARFINKNPDNSVRIRYLYKLFPDAYFIHIIRDARAVCHSLLKFRQAAADFFGPEHRFASNGVKSKAWLEIKQLWDSDPTTAIGLLWRDIIETLEFDRQFIPPEQYLEIRYEDFVSEPILHLKNLIQFCQLSWDERIEKIFLDSSKNISMGNRNAAWKEFIDPKDLEKLKNIVELKMGQYGYNLNCF
jgi:Sulfotransferase family